MRLSTTFGLSKVLVVGAAALALGGGAYAFTASNTVSSSPAGMGESSAVSGYNATNVVWTPDSTNPANVQKVAFSKLSDHAADRKPVRRQNSIRPMPSIP